jgi:fructosamine-3-kinase
VKNRNVRTEIKAATGYGVSDMQPLTGGCIAQVYRVTLEDKTQLVAKIDSGDNPRLDVEGYMLRFLKQRSKLPVPDVLYSKPELLLITFLEGESRFSRPIAEHAAELLAQLHQIRGPNFGFEKDTLIGPLIQPNPWSKSWLSFFREERLLHMARDCVEIGRFSAHFYSRIERFAGELENWLHEPEFPSLIHGDVWTSNVLARGDRVTGFLDPAIYYAAPEIELAFTTLFGTFDKWFFARYREMNPIQPGFFEERKDIYNLYPLLVHVRLFGGNYVNSVDHILQRFGY